MSKLDMSKLRRLSGAALESVLAAHDVFMTANVEFSGRKIVGKQADLRKRNLDGADFRGRNLESAHFNYSSLRGADFTGANVRGAWFTGADLTGAKGFTREMIRDNFIVIKSWDTTLPEPFESEFKNTPGFRPIVPLSEWVEPASDAGRKPNRPAQPQSTHEAKRHGR